MKTLILFFSTSLLFLFNATCSAQTISFETQEIDYGTVAQGSNGVRHFSFTNTGTAPLVISNAQKSCGCTIPTWPKEPIMPGQSAEIKVKYDTNRPGAFSKYVTITSNDRQTNTHKLHIKGTVVKEAAATPAKEATVFK